MGFTYSFSKHILNAYADMTPPSRVAEPTKRTDWFCLGGAAPKVPAGIKKETQGVPGQLDGSKTLGQLDLTEVPTMGGEQGRLREFKEPTGLPGSTSPLPWEPGRKPCGEIFVQEHPLLLITGTDRAERRTLSP